MIRWLLSRFRRHDFQWNKQLDIYGGTEYLCPKCQQKLRVPSDWTFRTDIRKLRGCKGK